MIANREREREDPPAVRARQASDESKKPRGRPRTSTEPGTPEELRGLIWRAARKGSTPAMKMLLDLEKAASAHEKPRSAIDQLSLKRRSA